MSHIVYNTCLTKKLTVFPPLQPKVTLKSDSGATKTYVRPQDQVVLFDQQKIVNGPRVGIPNGMNMQTIENGFLPLHKLLTKKDCQANILKGLNNTYLLSIGQLCDDNCIAIFDKRFLTIYKCGHKILRGV